MQRSSRMNRTAAVCGVGLLTASAHVAAPTRALDLDWTGTGPLLFYDTPTNWTPNAGPTGPTDADNLTFAQLISPTPNIIIGAPSQGNNLTFSDNEWVFTGAPGATLDTEGAVTLDAVGLGNTVALTVNAGVDWDTVGDLFVGDIGNGTLTLEADADFRGSSVYIGDDLGAVGVLNVDDAGTTLTADAVGSTLGIFIGNAGTGTLNVTDGGYVTTLDTAGAADIELGTAATGDGTLNIDGAGSLVNAEDTLIGVEGSGTLNITNGGVFDQNLPNNSPDGFVAFNGGTGAVAVNGSGSQWLMRRLDIGRRGVGTLSVENGGLVRANEAPNGNDGDVVIGTLAAGVDPVAEPLGDGSVAVFGVGSTLDVDDNLIVGDAGKGTLRIGQDLLGNANGNGNLQVDVNLIIADDAGNTNANLAVFDGANVTANVDNVTFVGHNGAGTLEVTSGAQLTTRFLRVGHFAGADGTLLLDGADSLIDTDSDTPDVVDDTVIGFRTTGTTTVSNGARLRTDELWVGFESGGDGTLIVDGGTVNAGVDNQTSGSDLTIGGRTSTNGGTGSLTIQNGGVVTSAVQTFVGGNATGTGTLTVTGVGSLFDNDDNGAGGASNDILRFGQSGAGTGFVLDGGRIEAEGIIVGQGAGSATAELTVRGTSGGTPSTIETGGYLIVGNARPGTMTIDQGAQVSVATNIATERIFIGDDNAADGSTLTISDPGSRLDYFGTGDVSVGNAGGSTSNRASLNVLNGGVFSAVQDTTDARIIIGDVDNGNGAVNVDGAGSLVEARVIYVGDGTNNSSGVLNLTNGGVATTVNEVEVGSNGNGVGTVLVDGDGSRLEVGDFLSLGDDVPGNGSATGTLLVNDGGAVTTGGQAYIGHFNGSTGNVTVTSVTDDSSTWDITGDLILAGTETTNQSSGSGSLGVLTGGRVTVQGDLLIRNLGAVVLNGGEILASSLEFIGAGADLDWFDGTLRFINTPTVDLSQTLLERSLDSTQPTLVAGQTLAVDNTAVLSSPLRVDGGEFSVGDVFDADLSNLDFDAGTFRLTQADLFIGPDGSPAGPALFGDSLTITETQTVAVANNALIDPTGTLTVVGTFSAGTLTNLGDLVLVDPTNTGKTFDPVLNTPAGSTVTLVGDTTFTGNVSGAGDFFGPGDATFAGGYNPGDSPATVAFESGFNLVGGQTLAIELAGTGPEQFDRLEAGGAVTLDGDLVVTLLSGFTPTLGDTFEIIDALGGVTGAFDGFTLPSLAGGLAWDVVASANAVTLAVISAGVITGDYDSSGQVEQGDLDIVLQNWGTGNFTGDPNALVGGGPFDGQVDQNELDGVLQNWGNTSAPDFTGAAVPEPAGLTLLGLLGVAAARYRR